MNVTLLHGAEAGEAPEDPVLGQIEEAVRALGHDVTRTAVAGDIVPRSSFTSRTTLFDVMPSEASSCGGFTISGNRKSPT